MKTDAFLIPGLTAKGTALYTRAQLASLLISWGFPSEKPPGKGKALLLQFPTCPFPAVRVVASGSKSITGHSLFAAVFYAKEEDNDFSDPEGPRRNWERNHNPETANAPQ